jgi:hypothetical protein
MLQIGIGNGPQTRQTPPSAIGPDSGVLCWDLRKTSLTIPAATNSTGIVRICFTACAINSTALHFSGIILKDHAL